MSEPTFNLQHLSKLARISLPDDEKERLMPQLDSIIGYCSKLATADVDGLEPMVHTFEHDTNVWFEEDMPEPSTNVDYLTQNAPEIKDNQIVVPRVL